MTYAILKTAGAARPSEIEIPAVGAVAGGVRALVRAEGLALAVAATAAYVHAGFSWGLFATLLLAPDLSFLAYLPSVRDGALRRTISSTARSRRWRSAPRGSRSASPRPKRSR